MNFIVKYILKTNILIILFFLLLPNGLNAASLSVNINSEKTVAGPRVSLAEIADFKILNSEGTHLIEQLSNIDLGAAPAPGQSLILRRGQIEQRLKASGLNLAVALWSIPEEILLTGQGQNLNEELLKKALENYLREIEPYKSGRFELLRLNFGQLPSLPPGEAAYRFVPQSSSNPSQIVGIFYFAVDGKEVSRLRVTAQIDLYVEAVVAAKGLSKGQVLNESDLSLTLIPYAQAKGALTTVDMAMGNVLKSNLASGEAIRDRNLSKNILVRRGDMVTIIASQGGLKVSAAGQAKQDGALGEMISVVNINSKKLISARVSGPNQVEVLF